LDETKTKGSTYLEREEFTIAEDSPGKKSALMLTHYGVECVELFLK
jgi:hypothetical protein